MANQTKATEQYFPVALCIVLYKMIGVKIQMKATEQYFSLVLLIVRYKVVLILSLWIES